MAAAAILDHRKITSDFWAGYQTMLACDAAQQAAAERRPVDIAALDAKYRGTSAAQQEITS